MPGRRPFPTRRRGPGMPKGCSGLQVSQDGQHPAVAGVRGCQPELAEDVPDVLLDGPLGTTRIPPIAALERPSAIRASPSRSLAVSVPSLPVRRLAPMSCVTTPGSRAVPPAATRLSASTNSPTPAGGRFAPGHLGELTRQVPFEMTDAVLEETCQIRRRVRDLPARVAGREDCWSRRGRRAACPGTGRCGRSARARRLRR